MKKIMLVVLIVLLLAAVAIAMVGRSSVAPTPMGSVGVSQPAYASRLLAGLRVRFTTGKSEMQRALEAKKEARSFRMTTLLHLHPGRPLETVVEVSCPDRERFTPRLAIALFMLCASAAKHTRNNWMARGPCRTRSPADGRRVAKTRANRRPGR